MGWLDSRPVSVAKRRSLIVTNAVSREGSLCLHFVTRRRESRSPCSAREMLAESSDPVDCGLPIRTHGIGRIGGIEIACDGTIAGQIWGAGAALAKKLLDDGLPERPETVEVGSGTGVAGLAAACAGASRVVLTDLPEAVPRLVEAIERNKAVLQGAEVSAAACEWGDADAAEAACGTSGCDLVLAADVLYSGEASVHRALRATLRDLALPRDARILHCYECRWPEIIKLWRSNLGKELVLVSRTELQAPCSIGGRSLVLEELRVNDEWIVDDGEDSDTGTAVLTESRAARSRRGF